VSPSLARGKPAGVRIILTARADRAGGQSFVAAEGVKGIPKPRLRAFTACRLIARSAVPGAISRLDYAMTMIATTSPAQDTLRSVPPQSARTVLRQRCEQLAFFHWAYHPELIQRNLPRGLSADTFDGKAWVGLVPTFPRNVRAGFGPTMAYPSAFFELALRTYVVNERGEPGVFMYSVACNQRPVVEAARMILGLRYEHAAMTGFVDDAGYATLVAQRLGGQAIDRLTYRSLSTPLIAESGSLEHFLVERAWVFGSDRDGLVPLFVRHAPYRILPVELTAWGEEDFALARLPRPRRAPDHQCAVEAIDLEVVMHGPPPG
jgi:uncharacterized protein YqjF (DUF2071 family)